MANLTMRSGRTKEKTFALPDRPQSLGRDGDIQIIDTSASRKHAEIFKLGEMFLIKDLHSRNGTFVNETKISEETPLHTGDRIRIGSSMFIFEGDTTVEHAVEFIQDEAPAASASTVEIRLGDRAARVVTGTDKARTGSTMSRLFTMYEAARVLGRESSVQGTLDKVLDLAMESVKPAYCYIFSLEEASDNLEPRAWRDPARRKQPRQISRSIIMRAMRHRHSILTANAAADSRFNESESVVIGGIRSVLCAPLIARDHINGVLYMGRDGAADTFEDADLELTTAIAFQAGIALENAATQNERRTEIVGLVRMLVGAMDLRVPELRGHSERVAAYASAIADELGLPARESEQVLLTALLHDAGKMKITENTHLAVGAALGRSVPDEYCHTYLGAKLVEELPALAAAIPGIRHHHERLDGFGGPEGLSGESIPLLARIVAVANRFDHLVTDPTLTGRPLPMSEALESIEQPGEGLDDTVTHALVRAQTTGSGVQLPKIVLQEFC